MSLFTTSDDDDVPISNGLQEEEDEASPYDPQSNYRRKSKKPNEMKVPLATNAQAPAGHGLDAQGRTLRSEVGMMDDDEEMIASRRVIPSASQRRSKGGVKDLWKQLKDTINGVPKDLTGERTIYINNPPLNESSKFANNYVSTSKYNLISFIPKFFAGALVFSLVAPLPFFSVDELTPSSVFWWREQNNSRNMQTSSSFSRRVFNKSPTSRLQILTQLSHPSPWFFSSPHSRKLRKIW